ncbi:Agamous-like MADS-box protein AGL8 homolog [Linum perenne]
MRLRTCIYVCATVLTIAWRGSRNVMRYSYADRNLLPNNDTQTCLKARIEVLQKNLRNYNGEEIDSLNLRELQNLEQQLDSALKHVRSRKNQVMCESISELQKKDKALREQNNQLAKKVGIESRASIIRCGVLVGKEKGEGYSISRRTTRTATSQYYSSTAILASGLKVSYMELMRRLGIR